jgi:AraC-like DNA-binding protein
MLNVKEHIEEHPEKYEQFKVNDLLFVEYHCIVEELKSGSWTPNNFFIYVLTGKKKWKSGEKIHTTEPGDALFIKKGGYVVHQFFDQEFCSLLIFVPDKFIKNVIRKHQIDCVSNTSVKFTDTIISLNVNNVLSNYFHSVLSYFPKSTPPPKQLLKVKFEELIISILSDPENEQLARYLNNICTQDKISIREIMEANFMYNMRLEEFAKLSGRSLSTFRRDFKEHFNTTPGKWLTKKRLEYGKYLLESTDKSINEITFDSGFENPSHFSRIFKKRFGVAPSQFKEVKVS